MELNLLTEWCRLWVASLVDAGVTEFVICPGSRSTPLVAAVEQQLGVRLHINIDERSAAFFALGQAKFTGRPTALICTSGSAVTHFFPAIIEADRTRTPLLVLSADRPPELQGNSASQTIDQGHLFGNKVRAFVDLGVPENTDLALRGLQRKAAQAVATSLFPVAGVVHINIPARKPLEPVTPTSPAEQQLHARVSQLLERGAPRFWAPLSTVPEPALAAVVRLANAAQRPLIVAGPMTQHEAPSATALQAFVHASGWPVVAELTSQLRSFPSATCDAFDALLSAADCEFLAPDFVLQLGAPLVSSAWAKFQSQHDATVVVVSENDWPDPTNQARLVLQGNMSNVLDRLSVAVKRAAPAWAELWTQANSTARAGTQRSLDALSATGFNEASAVQILGARLQSSDVVVLGNSLPVRLADTVFGHTPGVTYVSQRGASGIDGLISMAAGVASVHAGRVYLLVGDISALHDLSGLGCLAKSSTQLTVVVLNNHGGRIFETLPIASRAPLDAWTTPHQLQLVRAGELFGVPSYQVDSCVELGAALISAALQARPSFIEAVVEPSGASLAYRTIAQNVASALLPLVEAQPLEARRSHQDL